MKNHRQEFSVERMASVLEVSRSGFYSWLRRGKGVRGIQRESFDHEVRNVFDGFHGRSGRDKVKKELCNRGRRCSRNRVGASLKRQGLRVRYRKKFKVTTDSRHSFPVAPNLLNRNFQASEPNRVWVSDITYLKSRKGWLYLTVIIDLYSRMVVGWCVSRSLGHEMVLAALHRAFWLRRPPKGLVFHSDRGIQYCCDGFRKVTAFLKIVQSMSRKGNCWDNAVAESFFSTLKNEILGNYVFEDLADAEQILFRELEVYYNRQRLHATLGNIPPAEAEEVRWQMSA
jgi:transposase InsO family protein